MLKFRVHFFAERQEVPGLQESLAQWMIRGPRQDDEQTVMKISLAHNFLLKNEGQGKQTWERRGHRAFSLSRKITFFCPSLGLCCPSFVVSVLQWAEYLNKPINHWDSFRTDRSGEVVFVKPLHLLFNPCSHLFAEYAHFFLEIS